MSGFSSTPKFLTLIFLTATALNVRAQVDHDVNFDQAIQSMSILDIDSISFDEINDLMHIFTESGDTLTHPLFLIENVTFSGITTPGQYPDNYVHCGQETEIVDVVSPNTGRVWMDRNLGANVVATNPFHSSSFGDLYQWGRFADGHQCRTSATTTLQSEDWYPEHDMFIIPTDDNTWFNWGYIPDDIWYGLNGGNNPCPGGYRLPTIGEFHAEFPYNDGEGWSSSIAFNSFLKLPTAGQRMGDGNILLEYTDLVSNETYQLSRYQVAKNPPNTSIIPGAFSFNSLGWIAPYITNSVQGRSIRCIKEISGLFDQFICEGVTFNEDVFEYLPLSGVVFSLPYSGGNGGAYEQQVYVSEGIEGLSATLNTGHLANGDGVLSFELSGIPNTAGVATFEIQLNGMTCNVDLTIEPYYAEYPEGTVYCGDSTEIVDVLNPATGKIWMDRNLGAFRAALSLDDDYAYGDLYQWGRFPDGHQCRNSDTTSVVSTSNQPGHDEFIIIDPYDIDIIDNWLSPGNNELWQGTYGTNIPCPVGYRIPTINELDAERLSWSSNDATGAYNSPLRWTLPSNRHLSGVLGVPPGTSEYWSSTPITFQSEKSETLRISEYSQNTQPWNSKRAYGLPVRCIKDVLQVEGDPIIGAMNCGEATTIGNLILQQPASNVSTSVPYSGGNGGIHSGQTVSSTGVSGLTAILTPNVLASGDGALMYSISGAPASVGTASFAIEVAGQSCTLNLQGSSGAVESLNCESASLSDLLIEDVSASGVSFGIEYTNGNGNSHLGQTVSSLGVSGLTAQLIPGNFANGNGTLNYTISGIPGSTGWAEFEIVIGGQFCTAEVLVVSAECASPPSGTVCNTATGQIWMDRNLGASQVATSPTDEAAFGHLYQWGRGPDGHQLRTSSETSGTSDTDQPGHNEFIVDYSDEEPYDWRIPQNDDLWQGINGINNPCPSGFRIPTRQEWENELGSWSSNDASGAYNSPLKLVLAGARSGYNGNIQYSGQFGFYTSSSVNDYSTYRMRFASNSALIIGGLRNGGNSVRCIKDSEPIPGVVGDLNCDMANVNGMLVEGESSNGVSFEVPYNDGNNGVHDGESVSSTGVAGLTATLSPGQFAQGTGELIYQISGTPGSTGIAIFLIDIGGQSCEVEIEVLDGFIGSLDCDGANLVGEIIQGVPVTDVSLEISYSNGNGGSYNGQAINSDGVSGVIAEIPPGNFAVGNGILVFTISGTPQTSGDASFTFNIGGQSCVFEFTVDFSEDGPYPPGTVHCSGMPTEVVEVINPATGDIWMDRNLGATQVATSSSDTAAFGDLYQWGRAADGHQCRNSSTTTVQSNTIQPGHDDFIVPSGESDWLNPSNINLWQGTSGLNNPCPEDFRLPSQAELNAESTTWGGEGAFGSPLKFTSAGYRDGMSIDFSFGGGYWSNTSAGEGNSMVIVTGLALFVPTANAAGFSVRCIKE